MRMRAIALLLFVVVVATIAYPRAPSSAQGVGPAVTPVAVASSVAAGTWSYSAQSPFFEVLPEDIQSLATSEPSAAARKVCSELGGEVGVIEPIEPDTKSISFVCRFVEPDVTMSVDFGELDRISIK